ncbi:uncharacterized protein LOC132544416 [Ylistrum balloti]|uniref:uncharacterized protein LOC132544416 n=1 Tax=Ylistrum balloti TaxID=509963 RepID=UPI002905B1F3|nr:uncharacterized protein LOC132544416 [Ylistrum balloti]
MDDVARNEREQILWTVGELQAMLNGIVQDIMEFSTLVGNMIYKERDEEQVQQPSLKTFDFAQTSIAPKVKGKKPITDRKELEAKDKKSQVFFLGQRAVGTVREIYDILSSSLELLHEEFEMIYRSFKDVQQRKAIEKALLSGQLPENIKLPGHEASGGPGQASMKFHGATTESLLTYYIHAYGQLQKTQRQKRAGPNDTSGPERGYMLSENITTEHRTKTLSVTSITSDTANTMQNAVMVLGIHRSKSEVDINSIISNDSTTSLKRSQTHVFVSTKGGEHIKPETMSFMREEARVATTTVPKKGLIKLTALENELDGTFNFGIHERDDTSDLEEIERQRRKHSVTLGKQKMLIRRKNIQEQILAGKQILEAEERQKEEEVDMEKALEEYTMGELSQNITQYIGSHKKRVGSSLMNEKSKSKVYEQEEEQKQQRAITLPAINTLNINVFGS